MARKTAIIIHGGVGGDSQFIQENLEKYEQGLRDALHAGTRILDSGGRSVDAVEAAVNSLEDNSLFNAGRGSAINGKAQVEMCASIMDGKNYNSGAVAIVKNVKNPISLAKAIMLNTDYIYIGGAGALDYAQKINISLEPDSYFITEHQYDKYAKQREDEFKSTNATAREEISKRLAGTVGAVAIDAEGNIAAATSTGGTPNAKEGRIGDSSMIGVGSFADNRLCGVSTTGDGEYLIRGVIAYDIAAVMDYKGLSLEEACDFVVKQKHGKVKGYMGVIAIDKDANIAQCFNGERMHRAWRTKDGEEKVMIYKDQAGL